VLVLAITKEGLGNLRKPMPKTSVGYRSPPPEHRFRPGKSGNPAGRPKANPTFAADLRDALAEIVAVDGVKQAGVTKQRMIIRTLLREAMGGDLRAINTIVTSCARVFGRDDAADEPDPPEDRAIMRALGANRKNASPSVATPDPKEAA
jgi:hypothetical protein